MSLYNKYTQPVGESIQWVLSDERITGVAYLVL